MLYLFTFGVLNNDKAQEILEREYLVTKVWKDSSEKYFRVIIKAEKEYTTEINNLDERAFKFVRVNNIDAYASFFPFSNVIYFNKEKVIVELPIFDSKKVNIQKFKKNIDIVKFETNTNVMIRTYSAVLPMTNRKNQYYSQCRLEDTNRREKFLDSYTETKRLPYIDWIKKYGKVEIVVLGKYKLVKNMMKAPSTYEIFENNKLVERKIISYYRAINMFNNITSNVRSLYNDIHRHR